ncbi:MAG: hypothetical protein KDA95_00245 [Acidimicrobiales bacterium]|nr:hypothetical protein [Acidimicrobiales bacterium]
MEPDTTDFVGLLALKRHCLALHEGVHVDLQDVAAATLFDASAPRQAPIRQL